MLKVKITIEDNNRKAELEISEADNISKLVIIQNVFSLFGIDNDVMDMVADYKKIGSAYSSFFSQVDPVEPTKEEIEDKSSNIKRQLTEGLILHHEVLKDTYATTDDQPEYIRTGIKIDPDGTKRYRLRYHCYACYNRGTHYVPEDSKMTWCHKCRHEMPVLLATNEPFPVRDTFGNFYRAGDFQDRNIK